MWREERYRMFFSGLNVVLSSKTEKNLNTVFKKQLFSSHVKDISSENYLAQSKDVHCICSVWIVKIITRGVENYWWRQGGRVWGGVSPSLWWGSGKILIWDAIWCNLEHFATNWERVHLGGLRKIGEGGLNSSAPYLAPPLLVSKQSGLWS